MLNKESEQYKDKQNKLNEIFGLLATIEAQNPEEIDKIETINLMTAKGIKLALDGNIEDSKNLLSQASKRLELFRKEYAKLRYLIDSFYTASAIIFVVVFFILVPALFPLYFIDIIERLDISNMFLVVISCGALGGFLSIASGIKQIEIDPDNDVKVAATSRIFIAVISSVIIYIALRSNLVPNFSNFLLNETQEVDVWKVGLVSAAAGFTESLVPNILKKQHLSKPPAPHREDQKTGRNETPTGEGEKPKTNGE